MASEKFFPRLPSPNTQMGVPDPCLYSGAKFKGERRWRNNVHQVMEVELQHVDMDNDMVYGILTLKGSNNNKVPTKITYFEGEIVGKKHSFQTGKWFADAETDKVHWWKFDCFYKFAQVFRNEQFDYACLKGSDHVYMRWKECPCASNVGFVAPGFYYVTLSKAVGLVEGIYYESACEEWYEDTFSIRHIQQNGIPVFEFR